MHILGDEGILEGGWGRDSLSDELVFSWWVEVQYCLLCLEVLLLVS